MATYAVRIAVAARRQLERLQPPIQARVRIAIRALGHNAQPTGAALLSGLGKATWRIRIGDYRVLYEIQGDELIVLVVAVGHRREVYRRYRISESIAAYGLAPDRPVPHGGRSWSRDLYRLNQGRP